MARAGRKRKKQPTVAQTAIDLGATPQRVKQAGSSIEFIPTGKAGGKTPRMVDWPLAQLQEDGDIDPIQYEAGEKYYRDWYNSGLLPSGAIDYAKDKVDTSRTDYEPQFRLEAKQAFHAAVKVNGPLVKPIVDAVCLFGAKPSDDEFVIVDDDLAEQVRKLLKRSTRYRRVGIIAVLQIGLDALAVSYRMKRVEQPFNKH